MLTLQVIKTAGARIGVAAVFETEQRPVMVPENLRDGEGANQFVHWLLRDSSCIARSYQEGDLPDRSRNCQPGCSRGNREVPYTPWLQFSHPILLNIMGALHWLIVWLDVGYILSQ